MKIGSSGLWGNEGKALREVHLEFLYACYKCSINYSDGEKNNIPLKHGNAMDQQVPTSAILQIGLKGI